jgi:hypothetical protein
LEKAPEKMNQLNVLLASTPIRPPQVIETWAQLFKVPNYEISAYIDQKDAKLSLLEPASSLNARELPIQAQAYMPLTPRHTQSPEIAHLPSPFAQDFPMDDKSDISYSSPAPLPQTFTKVDMPI